MNIPYGYVYRIRNKINGKTYVGQRKLSLDKQWRQYMGSGVAVKAAIAKYGADSFTKELLTYAFSYDELNKIELVLITQEKQSGKAEYNLHIGSPVPKDALACKNLSAEQRELVYKARGEKIREHNNRKYEHAIAHNGDDILSLYHQYQNCAKVATQLNISRHYVSRFLKEKGITLNYQNIKGKILDDSTKKRISDGVKKSPVRFQLTCNTCGSIFESKSVRGKHCKTCYPKPVSPAKKISRKSPIAKLLVKVCQVCKKEFERKPSEISKFCSKECAIENTKKELPSIEVIRKLYWEDNLSANKIGAIYEVSGQTIRKYMERNGINRRGERRRP